MSQSRWRSAALAVASLTATGCPQRYEVFRQGQPWQFLTPAESDLNPAAGRQAAGYVFDVTVEGEIYATLNLQNPEALYHMFLLKEGVGQPIATALGRASQPVRMRGKATPGRFGIAIVAAAGASRFTLDTALKPNDPVAKSRCPNAMQPAVLAFRAAAAGKVAWASQEQSCFYKISVPADGTIKTRVQAKAPGKPSLSLVNAQGAEEALAVPTDSKEVTAGDWFVRVYANDIADFAEYQLVVDFATGDGPAAPTGRLAGSIKCGTSGSPTLGILDVRASGFTADQSALFTEALRSEIVRTKCYRVQDRGQMREILATQQVNSSEICDESCAVEAGRLLQVAMLASARIAKSDTGAWTIATITDVQTGTVLKSVRVRASAATDDAVMESLPELARQLVE